MASTILHLVEHSLLAARQKHHYLDPVDDDFL